MSGARERFREASKFCFYYGHGAAEGLAAFDAAVLEPAGQRPEDVRRLQAGGTLAIAYAGVMEVADHDPLRPLLKDEVFARDDRGERLRNREYGTELVSLSSRRWRGLLQHRIGGLLAQAGYDGVFVDTIANCEWEELGAGGPREIEAAASFVAELRRTFPDRIIVQNNGVVRLIGETAPHVDAVVWENPPVAERALRRHTENLAERLADWSRRHGFRVVVLEEMPASAPGKAAELAARHGFSYAAAPRHYLSLPDPS